MICEYTGCIEEATFRTSYGVSYCKNHAELWEKRNRFNRSLNQEAKVPTIKEVVQ